MKMMSIFGSLLRRVGVATLLVGVGALANATPIWQESNALQSTLGNTYGYASDPGTRTATVTYTNQIATNTDSVAHRFGMYLGWAWSYDGAGLATSLPWSNGSGAFVGGDVSLKLVGQNSSVLLSSIVGDTWIGNPWGPGYGEAPIATVGDWDVPLYDFGVIAAGGSASYDIELRFTFANDAAFDDWNQSGSFYIGGQGVQAVPEPGSLGLVALALLGAAAALRTPARGRKAELR